jgi:hypothetical protein
LNPAKAYGGVRASIRRQLGEVASDFASNGEDEGGKDVAFSRYFASLAAIWVIAMMWRVYPQFGDTLRLDGRLMTFSEYVDEICGQRVGPAAASCIEQARGTGRRLVAREQGKSVLLVVAPLLGYLLLYRPLRLALERLRRLGNPLGADAGSASGKT